MNNIHARRVLFYEGNFDGTVGGSYFSLLFLASGLDRQRFEPIVAFATGNPLLPEFQARRVRTLIWPRLAPIALAGSLGRIISGAMNFARGWIVEPVRLAAMFRRENIALVHLNNSITGSHAWMVAAMLAKIPCITHQRGIKKQFDWPTRWLARRLAAVICISTAVRDGFDAAGLGYLHLVTVHNGLDPTEMHVTRPTAEIRAELGVSSAARLIGIVGNIKPWKGQEVVIRAMAILRDEFPDVTCVLIGDTSPGEIGYRQEILKLIDSLGLAGRIAVTGFRHDVANYISALEIQIHASIRPEPFGRVLLEAMALGKPLVASGAGAVPEIVVDGETGLLFEPARPEALAACLRTLLSDPELARAMGAAGRRRLEAEFSIQQHIQTIERVYEGVTRR